MPTKKIKQKLLKRRICSIARVVACASFLVLTVIGVSSLVRAMSLESIEHQNGIPASWQVASLGNPETIDIPITYWDQRQDACWSDNQQFEWSQCRLYAKGIIPNVVKDTLGSDGLPVPTYADSNEAWNAYHDIFTQYVTGHDPVQTTDNFYRWFHETTDANGKQLSKRYDREVTFHRTGENTYEYGSRGTFPLDDVNFSKDDDATSTGHNFHFTAHMQIPMKIAADGIEEFWFSGDDDVWVFLNGHLVLDLGGLHSDTEGYFTIGTDGVVTSVVNDVNDQTCRQNNVGKPLSDSIYNNQISACGRSQQTTRTDIGLKAGDVVNLDFFYAERSTSESNTRIKIQNMQWPISADSNVDGSIEGKIENTSSNLVEYITSVTNRDPMFPLTLQRMSAYIDDESSYTDEKGETQTVANSGFIPLSEATLYYATSLDNPDWQPVEISAPQNSSDGFVLKNPITLNQYGQTGDTVYFRYYAETSEYSGTITNRTSYYTELNGASGVTYDHIVLPYTGKAGPDEETTYDVTVTYRIEVNEGDDPATIPTTPDPVTETHKDGEHYEINSPVIEGYEPDYEIVEGTVDGSDVNREVVYHRKTEEPTEQYKVTVHYIKSDGSPAFDDLVEMVNPGDNFSHTPQGLEGYTHTPTEITESNIQQDLVFTVTYTPIRVEHTVTVHYVYENGSEAAEDFVRAYEEGTKFSIESPVIDGYRRDIAVVEGVMGERDREFTVTYTMIDNPVGPDPIIPIGPTDPSDPDEPTTPETPDENDNLVPDLPVTPGDDDLTYTGPLGEVAFVPNSGVVSDMLSPIFTQDFAEVILSQGFVLATLLIFAGSFSTYFSLRKYLAYSAASSTTRGAKKMPKSVGNSKTARKMQKAAKKFAKVAAKAPRKNCKK